MSLTFSRKILNSLLPQGWFWTPKAGSDYDLLLDGVSDNSGVVYADLKLLSSLRDPLTTPILSDLEKEYAVVPFSGATDTQRREVLQAFMFRRSPAGYAEIMEDTLRKAGFTDINVIPNDPACNPKKYLNPTFSMTCGDGLECGEPGAICQSLFGGELIVNGDCIINTPDYKNECGELGIECGEDVLCGDFDGWVPDIFRQIQYTVPVNPGYWPLFFFVGGEILRDTDGTILYIKSYDIPMQKRAIFRSIVLKYKAVHAWGVACVNYI